MRSTVAAYRGSAACNWSLTSRCRITGPQWCRWSHGQALSITSRRDERHGWPFPTHFRRPLNAGASLKNVSPRRYASSHATALGFEEPTIYALSSAAGRAAIAVIRVSGSASLDIYRSLCPGRTLPRPRTAAVRSLYEPGKNANKESMLDSSALVLYFPAPNTVTGEDILEFHVHGGPAIVKAVLAAVAKCADGTKDIRYAEPGEFTRRAFMHNRVDLTQVEALGDTLSADTEQQRRLSVRGTTGALAKQYEQWRQQLLYARGELEALIDFSEDQHFDESPAELCASVAAQVHVLRRALQVHSQNAVRGELLRHGISVALLGAPNAGKSSLLNRIIGREAAIVSQQAGTTRDIVEIGLDLGGYFCRFGDTAGLRQAAISAQESRQKPEVINEIEVEGMRRAKARAAESDLVVVVFSFETNSEGRATLKFDPEVCAVARELTGSKNNIIVVVNKSDLSSTNNDNAIEAVQDELPNLDRASIHMISCMAAQQTTAPGPSDPGGIQAFLQGLIGQFGRLTAALTPADAASDPDVSIWQESLGASERHRVLLESCVGHLDAFIGEVEGARDDSETSAVDEQAEADIVVAAEHLRGAAECLAKITGKGEAGDVEEVLGVVFEKFCVGK